VLQGTPSRIGGVTFEILAKEAYERHYLSYGNHTYDMLVLRNPGLYHWRSGGEKHINDPLSIANLQVRFLLPETLEAFFYYGSCFGTFLKDIVCCQLERSLETLEPPI
jgi:glutamate synthase domain-containing protein 2